jgi:heterodisulfide reductase subunit C
VGLILVSEKKAANETSRVITIRDLDPKFKYEMKDVRDFEKLRMCFQCGTCVADCPIARYSSEYHPRKLMRMAQLGMKDRLLGSEALWLCASCFTCVDHCPQGVDLAGVLRALRNIAVREGIVPQVFKELTDNIMKTGYAYKIPELRKKKRLERGLPALPESNTNDIAKFFDLLSVSEVARKEK